MNALGPSLCQHHITIGICPLHKKEGSLLSALSEHNYVLVFFHSLTVQSVRAMTYVKAAMQSMAQHMVAIPCTRIAITLVSCATSLVGKRWWRLYTNTSQCFQTGLALEREWAILSQSKGRHREEYLLFGPVQE